MPCTYEETPEEKREAAAKAKARRDRELNRVTRLLCAVCKAIVSKDNETFADTCRAIAAVPGLDKWWSEHRKRDARKSK